MTPARTRLVLVTPPLAGETEAARAPVIAAALGAADVAALVLRLVVGPGEDERSVVNRVKRLVPDAQAAGCAALLRLDGAGTTIDPAMVAARGGADGVHLDLGGRDPDEAWPAHVAELRARLAKDGRMLGVGGIDSKHAAMAAGEAGVDYLLFGEVGPDGPAPALDDVAAQAGWWAEIFETPCVALAPRAEDAAALARTGAEFVALLADFADAASAAATVARAAALIERRPVPEAAR